MLLQLLEIMLTFYYNPLSVNARRVWVALLEKNIPFEPIFIDLGGEQFGESFSAINPLQRIPVIVDDNLRIVESLAILDYLEARYPAVALMPKEIEAIATVRMVEMIAVNELQPATLPLTRPLVGLEVAPEKIDSAKQRITDVLSFYEQILGNTSFFASETLTLADIVAGTLVPSLSMFGVSLAPYPRLSQWLERLLQRESWQQTTPTSDYIEAAIPSIRKILERRS